MSRIWAVESAEHWGNSQIGHDGQRHLVFADSAYGQAVDAFNAMRIEHHLSPHVVQVIDDFGPDAHAWLRADDGDDSVELRPYDVIGG